LGRGKDRFILDRKITVSTNNLNAEQMKFLNQYSEFHEDRWEAQCDPDHYEGSMSLLKWAGITGCTTRSHSKMYRN
jgi:hypothetical protein